jgi:L-asparaginase
MDRSFMMQEKCMSPVTILSLGGTILSRFGSSEPVRLEALTADLPKSDLTFAELARVGSNQLTFADIKGLAAEIIRRHQAKPQSFVVLQGTDTLEETSFLLDLLIPVGIPVVVTGAMRTADAAGADGPANLRDAIAVARRLVGLATGVVVCFAGELHAARLVRKIDANRPAAFASPGFGPIGTVTDGQVRLVMRLALAPGPYRVAGPVPLVGLMTLTFAMTATEAEASLAPAFAGLVVAGLGAGTMPPDLDPLLALAASRYPVLITSRCGQGEVSAAAYVGQGTTHHLVAQGVIAGGAVEPRKARILLTVLLWSGLRGADLLGELKCWLDLGL